MNSHSGIKHINQYPFCFSEINYKRQCFLRILSGFPSWFVGGQKKFNYWLHLVKFLYPTVCWLVGFCTVIYVIVSVNVQGTSIAWHNTIIYLFVFNQKCWVSGLYVYVWYGLERKCLFWKGARLDGLLRQTNNPSTTSCKQ